MNQTARKVTLLSVVTLALLTGASSTAYADGSPWVLPQDATVMQLQFRYEFADREFLPDGTNQPLSINGQLRSQNAELSLRRGLGHGFELSIDATYKFISYDADPVQLSGVDETTGERIPISPVFDFNDQIEGFSDIIVATRYNAYKGAILVTPELAIKIPTGYTPPSGTFANDSPDVGPGRTQGALNIEDDLALGDGQVDITASLLLGAFSPKTKTFGKLSGGFRARFSGPGQQLVWGAKAGQFIGSMLVVFIESTGVKTITDGDIIGTSFATRQPETPALGFPVENLDLIDLRVDKDYTNVSMGMLLKLERFELIISGGKIVDGANITEINAINTGTVYRF